MANPRGRRKVRAPLTKVSRRNRTVGKSIILDETVKKYWDSSDTVERNYLKVGLANRLNEDINKKDLNKRLEEWGFRRAESAVAEFDSEDEACRELESIFARPSAGLVETEAVRELEAKSAVRIKPRVQKLSEFEGQYIGRLLQAYGEDYVGMARCLKLNNRQLTPTQLEKLANRSKASA